MSFSSSDALQPPRSDIALWRDSTEPLIGEWRQGGIRRPILDTVLVLRLTWLGGSREIRTDVDPEFQLEDQSVPALAGLFRWAPGPVTRAAIPSNQPVRYELRAERWGQVQTIGRGAIRIHAHV